MWVRPIFVGIMFIELILAWLINSCNESLCLINVSFAQTSELIWSQLNPARLIWMSRARFLFEITIGTTGYVVVPLEQLYHMIHMPTWSVKALFFVSYLCRYPLSGVSISTGLNPLFLCLIRRRNLSEFPHICMVKRIPPYQGYFSRNLCFSFDFDSYPFQVIPKLCLFCISIQPPQWSTTDLKIFWNQNN